jgi:biopolymer transport protein ExbD
MRKNKRREKKEALDLDITSLLDILVILLVFLLKSFNASELEVTPVTNLTIPHSESRNFGHRAIQIQVNRDLEVFINNKKIGVINSKAAQLDFLKEKLEELKKITEQQNSKKQKEEIINIILDEKLNYATMEQIMHTSAMAGFSQFKFVVQGNYE